VRPDEIAIAIAGHGTSPSLQPFVDRPLDSAMWGALVTKLEQYRLLAFAIAAASTGTLPVTEQQSEELRSRTAEIGERRLIAAQCVDEVVATLNRESIDSCVLHGAATSVLDYPQADRRLYETIDVLVSPAELDDVVTLLREEGLLRMPAAADHRPTSRRRRGERFVAANGTDIGIQSALTPGRLGSSLDARDLFANRVPFTPRTVKLSAIGPEERLIVACIRARFGRPTYNLLYQRDIVQLVLRDDLSLRKVERLASSWHVEALLADTVRCAWETFAVPDVVPISAWSRSYRPHRRDRRKLAAHPLPEHQHAESLMETGSIEAATIGRF
jgi:hypothetical protein